MVTYLCGVGEDTIFYISAQEEDAQGNGNNALSNAVLQIVQHCDGWLVSQPTYIHAGPSQRAEL